MDDDGLHITCRGEQRLLDVDTVIVCAGQEPLRELQQPLHDAGLPVHLIGGSYEAGELDAKRAIDMGARLAAQIEDAKPGDVFQAPPGTAEKLVGYALQWQKKVSGR